MLLLLFQKDILENEKVVCPLCGSEIDLVVEEQKDKEKSEFDLINEDDWLLP